MSTSILYHGFGIKGYKFLGARFEGGVMSFRVSKDKLRCASCDSRDVLRRGQVTRNFRTVPVGRKAVLISLAIQRLQCLACGLIRQAKIGFADSRRSYTKAFERYALELCRSMTILDMARHLGVSWDVIKDIQKRNLLRRFSKPKLKKLRKIAIDEITIGKGHQYLTIVMDLETGAVIFVAEGKGGEGLEPFWKKIARARARIEAVATDMSPAYIGAVIKNLKEAVIVLDHFHVIKLFNDKLAEFRRNLHTNATTALEKRVLKGTRWLLLKALDNLNENRNEHQRLQQALELNMPLATAYYMKEDLRQLWSQKNKTAAATFLDDWIARATASNVTMLVKFARTLKVHRSGILNYYDYPISTAPLEGTNNKIKTMTRQAYGFRDKEFFKLKIMALHQTKYALVG